MFHSADKTEDLSLGHTASQITLKDCSKEAKGEPGYIEIFATKTR